MIRLRVKDILHEKDLTKYWLNQQMHLSDKNLSRMLENETQAIKYENIEKLCIYLQCSPSDLFEIIPEDNNKE